MMKSGAAKLLAPVVCSLVLGGAAVVPAEAGIIPCIWNTLFGPCCGGGCGGGGYGGAYYGPVSCGGGCASGNCGVTYYAPSGCNTCAPCGGYSDSCYGGACAPSPAASNPPADDRWKKKSTFKNDAGNSGSDAGAGGASGAGAAGDAGSTGRTLPDTGLEGTRQRPGGLRDDGESTETFKKPATDGSSGIEPAGGEAVPVTPRGSKKSPSPPSIPDDNDENESLRAPSIQLDEKIAWRPAPERKRVAIRKDVANARLIRVPAYPRSGWLPVEPESNVASK